MPNYIGSGSVRLGRPDYSTCCWPTCNRETVDYPLCKHHQIKVHIRVREQADTIYAEIQREMNRNRKPDPRKPHVYFVRYRDRVKIGWSIDPRERVKAHPVDEILAIVPGDHRDEQRYHRQFAHLRENGEWFRAEAELLEYARTLTT